MHRYAKNWDKETRDYFNSLPPAIQEGVMQAGVPIENCDSLRHFATHMLAWHPEHHNPETTNLSTDAERYL